MTLLLGVAVVGAGVVALLGLQMRHRRDAGMGQMSAQWLAEHRAEHSG